jgi:hypothetical protein
MGVSKATFFTGECSEKDEIVELHSSTAPAARASGSVMRDWCNVFYPSYSETRSSKHAYCRLRARTRRSSLVTSRSSHSDVERSYASIFGNSSSCSSRLHCGVWRPLKTVSLNVLSPCAAGYCFSATQIGDVNKGIVERGVDVCDTPALNHFLLRHLSGLRRIFLERQHGLRHI